nr:site-specific integrase [Natrinema soli]
MRDRAIVVMLGGTGARGAELFADPKDEKRRGLRWNDVDFEKRLIEVYGKSREYEDAPFPESVHSVLERWYDYLEPPTDEWPVFPTGHYGSKKDALEAILGEERASSALESRVTREKQRSSSGYTGTTRCCRRRSRKRASADW